MIRVDRIFKAGEMMTEGLFGEIRPEGYFRWI
jgi:hypothetical protein